MSTNRVTKWDRLDLAYPHLHKSIRGRSPMVNTLRCQARIEPFELAARLLEDRGENDAVVQKHISTLGEDYRRRIAYWSGRVINDLDHPGGPGLLIGIAGLIGPLVLIATTSRNGPLSGLLWWQAALIGLPIAIPSAWLVVSSLFKLLSQSIPPAAALSARKCADCGCSLERAAPGLSKDIIGIDVGPRACTECRRPWPLVPPPADAVDMTDRQRAA